MASELVFDPRDPYPLVDLATVPYASQKAHAAAVDAWLGFEVESVESRLERESASRELAREQWIGLAPESLQTPYVEFRAMIEAVRPLVTAAAPVFADIGAAYGRLAFVLHAHWPEVRFLGLELAAARVEEGGRVIARHALPRAELRMADVVTAPLPPADIYFLYDFGSLRSIQALLEKLRERARLAPVTVLGRGRATRDEIERRHPWLSGVVEPRHFGNFTIYRSAGT